MMRTKFQGVFGEIDSLPGCSQVGVSHAVFVPTADRKKGWGTKANAARLEYMRDELGYDYALCTVDAGNVAQVKILADNGWVRLDGFKSKKTGHTVEIWGTELS